jgi:hypothetical protein
MAGRDYGYYTYTDNDGNAWSVKISKALGENADAGFGALDSTKALLPRGMKMRGINVMASGRNPRRVHIGSTTCDLWTGDATSIALPVEGSGSTVTYNFVSFFAEKPRRVAHDITNI